MPIKKLASHDGIMFWPNETFPMNAFQKWMHVSSINGVTSFDRTCCLRDSSDVQRLICWTSWDCWTSELVLYPKKHGILLESFKSVNSRKDSYLLLHGHQITLDIFRTKITWYLQIFDSVILNFFFYFYS